MTQKRCTACGDLKQPWEFSEIKRTGKYSSQCRTCRSKGHAFQPSKSDGAREARVVIDARLGFEVRGCTDMRGASLYVCPLLELCQGLPADEAVFCELEDIEAGLNPLRPTGAPEQYGETRRPVELWADSVSHVDRAATPWWLEVD